MNTAKKIFAISALAMGIAMPVSSFAQAMMDHGKMAMPHATDAMTDGEVKKIDADNGKVTLKHGEIKNLDMPGMTMVFTVRDKGQLALLKLGDKVKFVVVQEGGKMVVTDIQPVH